MSKHIGSNQSGSAHDQEAGDDRPMPPNHPVTSTAMRLKHLEELRRRDLVDDQAYQVEHRAILAWL
jgi:hypothetical protein